MSATNGANAPEPDQPTFAGGKWPLWGPNRRLDNPPGHTATVMNGEVTIGEQTFDLLPTGLLGDPATKLLWTIDDEGCHFIREDQPWDSARGMPSHTNLSLRAYAGGEAWRTGPNRVTINAASRAFGYNRDSPEMLAEAQARYEAAVRYMQALGLEVIALPFGTR